MSSGDFNNLVIRKTTSYQPDGSFVPFNSVFTAGQNGVQNWTNSLFIKDITVSTIFINSTFIFPSIAVATGTITQFSASTILTNHITAGSTITVSTTNAVNINVDRVTGSSMITSTFGASTARISSMNVASATYSTMTGLSNTVQNQAMNTGTFSTLTGLNVFSNTMTLQSTLTTSSLSTNNMTYQNLTGDSIGANRITVLSTIIASTINALHYTYSTLRGNTISANTVDCTSTLTGSTMNAINVGFSTLTGSTMATNTLIASDVTLNNMGYSSVIGSTLTTTLLQVNTVLTGSIMNMTTIQTSSLQGSTLTMNSMSVLSTITGSTINAANSNISSITGSTLGFNTVSIYSTITVSSLTGSTLAGSTMNMTAIGFSTIAGSTMFSNVLVVQSTMFGSTLTATNMNYSTLRGDNIQSQSMMVSTLTGSTINFINLAYSTLAVSTVTANVAFPLLVTGSTITTNTIGITSLMTVSTGGRVGVGTTAPSYPLTISNATFKGLEMNTCCSTVSGSVSSFTTGAVYSVTHPTSGFRAEYAYAYGGASTLASAVQTGANGYYVIDVAGSAGSSGIFASDTVGPTAASFYMNATKAVFQTGVVGVGITNPQWPITVGLDLAAGSAVSNPLSAQLVLRGKTNTGSLKIGSFYTSGSGVGVIQSSDISTGFDSVLPLSLNPLGGNVGIGLTNAPHTFVPFSNITLPAITTGVIWPAQMAVAGNPSAQLLLKMGSYYTGGVGSYCAIQSTETYFNVEHPQPLALQPIGGNVGIGMTVPNASLQFSNNLVNRKIVLWEGANNDHQYFGFGVNASTLRYQVNTVGDSHVFYVGASTTTSNELMRISGNGNVGIGTNNPSTSLYILNPTAQAGNTTMVTTQIMARPGTTNVQNNMSGGFAIGAALPAAASVGRLDIMVSGTGSAGNRFGLTPDIPVASFLGSGDVMIPNRECIVTQINGHGQFRAIAGNYGFMIRNDGANTYFLLTASGNQYGIYNGLRPLTINNISGLVTMSHGLTVSGAFTCNSINIIPTGIIVMWYGSVSNIPSGWYLCNGANGTPNLLDRFIVGAGNLYPTGGVNIGNEYNGTGGLKDVALTVAELPSHSHTASDSGHTHIYQTYARNTGNNADSGRWISAKDNPLQIDLNTTTGYANITVQPTGSGVAHENRPPYYALCYIMKA
jgi:hypothetical protein